MNISQKNESSAAFGGDDDDLQLDDVSFDDEMDEGKDDTDEETGAGGRHRREPDLVMFRIKSGKDDMEISVPRRSSVADAKDAVRRALRVPRDRYLRLIFRGRLLAPDAAPLSAFAVKEGVVVHAVVAAEGQEGGAQALLAHSSLTDDPSASAPSSFLSSSLSRRALRGTGLSATGQAVRYHQSEDEESSTEEDEEGGAMTMMEDQRPNGGALGQSATRRSSSAATSSSSLIRNRGFDRLRWSMGLRRSQVAVLRAYFSPHVDRWARNNPERARQLTDGVDDALLRRRIHEEAWMATQGPGSEFRVNLSGGGGGSADGLFPGTPAGSASPLFGDGMPRAGGSGIRAPTVVGTDRDFFWGFVLGYFVGFLMMLWVWMPTVPHKQKLGILTGISFHLALGLMKSGGDDYSDDAVSLD
jgi:hypothetical protein